MHITSLPGRHGIGTLGREAYHFVDFLIESGQKLWQILPLGHTGYGDSPYQCFSAIAGNPLLIDLDKLVEQELLDNRDLPGAGEFDPDQVEYGRVFEYKFPLLNKAYHNFRKQGNRVRNMQFDTFRMKNHHWLEDYAFFMALKDHFKGKPWWQWDEGIKLREPLAMNRYREHLHEAIDYYRFLQFLFYKQWQELRAYANMNDIRIIGDIPLYVAMDSTEAWASPENFDFDEKRTPRTVAGVPPDYFSETGQLWGNPIYNWKHMEENGFGWWIDRIRANFKLYDVLRIDHFRGLAAYWAVPYGQETAIKGHWIPAPGKEMLQAVFKELGDISIIAEDLGVITPDVVALRKHFDLPGMKILQFAFDSGEENDFIPHNYERECVVYTGTHDNDTTLGHFNHAKQSDKQLMHDYFSVNAHDPAWSFIRLAWSTVAYWAIAPLQDVLRLDTRARMNFPGKTAGYWKWRYRREMLTEVHADNLLKITKLYGRR